jgi:HEAT repeat protein
LLTYPTFAKRIMKASSFLLLLALSSTTCTAATGVPQKGTNTQPASPVPTKDEMAPLLKEFADAENFGRQLDVAKRIVALRDTGILDRLTNWLKTEDQHVRGNAAFIFAGLGDERGFEAIRGILSDRSARPAGQGRAGAGQDQIVADRYYAVHLLGALKSARAVPILIPLLGDPDINYNVAWALGEIGDRRAIQPLIAALKDRDPLMRVSAIQGLEKLKAKEALPALHELLDDQAMPSAGDRVPVAATAKAAIGTLERPTN